MGGVSGGGLRPLLHSECHTCCTHRFPPAGCSGNRDGPIYDHVSHLTGMTVTGELKGRRRSIQTLAEDATILVRNESNIKTV